MPASNTSSACRSRFHSAYHTTPRGKLGAMTPGKRTMDCGRHAGGGRRLRSFGRVPSWCMWRTAWALQWPGRMVGLIWSCGGRLVTAAARKRMPDPSPGPSPRPCSRSSSRIKYQMAAYDLPICPRWPGGPLEAGMQGAAESGPGDEGDDCRRGRQDWRDDAFAEESATGGHFSGPRVLWPRAHQDLGARQRPKTSSHRQIVLFPDGL